MNSIQTQFSFEKEQLFIVSSRRALVDQYCNKFDITNRELYTTDFFEIPDRFLPGPKAKKEWGILCSAWKNPVSKKKLGMISEQQARIVKNLRNNGFIFYKESSNYTINNGKDRYICGWELPPPYRCKSYIKISKHRLKGLLKERCDPYTTQTEGLQIDHKTPIEACIKLGIAPAVLDHHMLNSNSVFKYFQLLTINNNAVKREACAKCLDGQDIKLPNMILPFANNFKRRWDKACEENKSCIGCYWYGE